MQHLLSRAFIVLVVIGAGFGARQFADRSEPTWDPAVEPYVAFVEQTRELKFLEPVSVVRTDIAAALATANDDTVLEAEDGGLGYDPHAEATRLLGLTGPIENLFAAQGDVVEQGATAFYDSFDKTIVLPPGPVSPMLELTIVHELTHALQDQHGLLAYSAVESWSSSSFRRALIEGDASLVEYAWFDTLDERTREQLSNASEASPQPDGFLESEFGSSYALGPPVVASIIADGGYPELDSMLRRKSFGSDERLLDPFTDTPMPESGTGEQMVDPDGNEWFDGWIGAFGWYHALAPSVGAERALEAIAGYSDDVFVTFERNGEVCARFDVWFDTRNDAAEFSEALVPWGVVTNTINPARRTVRIDICEPVGDPSDQVAELMTPLVVNNWMAVEHQDHTSDASIIRCAARQQAISVGFADPNAIDWDGLEDRAEAARSACAPD